jgi:cell division protein FtsQ
LGCLIFIAVNFGEKLIDSSMRVPSQLLQRLGLSLENVYVEGRGKTSRDEILNALQLKRGDYIFKADLKECYDNIKKLKWVRSVMIERRLPSTLYIHLIEKKPMAFWQQKQKFYLIDSQGNVIDESKRELFPHFLVVTGEKAPQALPKLLTILNQYQTLRDQLSGAMYVGQRRWDLMLKNGMCINLPEADIAKSCQLILKLIKDNRLDNPKIKSVDLRNADRIYFYLNDTPQKPTKYEDKNA